MALQFAQASEDILKIKQEVDAELFPEDQTWGHNDANVYTSITCFDCENYFFCQMPKPYFVNNHMYLLYTIYKLLQHSYSIKVYLGLVSVAIKWEKQVMMI